YFRARLEIHHRSGQRRSDPIKRHRTQNVLRRVLLQILLGTSVRTTSKSPLRKIRGQRRRLVLAAHSLRQQPGQLPQLRRRHHAHSVEHRIHQYIPLIEQHAVIQKSRLPADGFLLHLGRIVVGEGAVSAAGIFKNRGSNRQIAAVVARVGRLLQTHEAILLQNRRIHRISGRGIVAPCNHAFHLPAGKLGRKDRGRRNSGGRRCIRRRRLGSKGLSTKKATKKQDEDYAELRREFHSEKGAPVLRDPCYEIRLPAAQESFHPQAANCTPGSSTPRI